MQQQNYITLKLLRNDSPNGLSIRLAPVADLGLTKGKGYQGIWGVWTPRLVGGTGLSPRKVLIK